MTARRHKTLAGATLVLSACLDLPPIEYRTEHLEIGNEYPGPIRAGTLEALDLQVEYVEDNLGVDAPTPIALYFVPDRTAELCKIEAAGCFKTGSNRIYTNFDSVDHELAHAVVDELTEGDAFFVEGNAGELEHVAVHFADTVPSSNLGQKHGLDVDRSTASHFMRWLREEVGADVVRSLMEKTSDNRGPAHAMKKFQQVVGVSFEAAERHYYETAPEIYGGEDLVEPPSVSPEGDRWDFAVEFDCSDVLTFGIDDEMWRDFIIGIPRDGWYLVEIEAPAIVLLTLRQRGVLDLGEPELGGDPWWPVGSEWSDEAEEIQPGLPSEVRVVEGEYTVRVRAPVTENPSVVRFSMHPKVGEK